MSGAAVRPTRVLPLPLLADPQLDEAKVYCRLGDLSQARGAFDSKIEYDNRYGGEDRPYTGTLDGGVWGLYPVGQANKRFLFCRGNTLLRYQRIVKGKARILWTLSLDHRKSPVQYRGTLGQYIHREGLTVLGKVTAEQKASLNAVVKYAGYCPPSPDFPWTLWFVEKDGSQTRTFSCDESIEYPILKEEAKALGLGSVSWPPATKFTPLLNNQ